MIMIIVLMKNPSSSRPTFYHYLFGYLFHKDSVSNTIFTLTSTFYTRTKLPLCINCLLILAILNCLYFRPINPMKNFRWHTRKNFILRSPLHHLPDLTLCSWCCLLILLTILQLIPRG